MPHIHDKLDFTVEVFIVHKNKVLLRKHDKYKIWLSIGGHIELNEDPNQAAIREVKEEVGLNVKLAGYNMLFSDNNEYYELIPPKFLNRHRINEDHEHISLIYFAVSDTDKLMLSQEELSEECRWFTLDELDNYDIKESIKFYARKALEELKL
ncbi:NUDIX domain-containing protein [Candidatus Woesearchaeota archaeon]|nr:NUDIX domain-containing protein [Candidatus Woesearchaeota archaeon]